METELMSANLLNDDILLRIFDYLHFDDKIRLRRTCSRWRHLLEGQLNKVKALRLGLFQQGGFCHTSGLHLQCEHRSPNHRSHTGALFSRQLFSFPADTETQCFSISQYDYLHRSLKYSASSITMLSLGRLGISYRLLLVVTNNLPNLEHLELLGCASEFDQARRTRPLASNPTSVMDQNSRLPSMGSFNNERFNDIQSIILYNQHNDEQLNIQQRLVRSSLIKGCDLIKEAKSKQHWSKLRHLLVKDCNFLNEFTLSLLLALTSQSLVHLVVESNQYLTGEFLNYCGPRLKILRVKYCPSLQLKFLQDLVKIKEILAPSMQLASSKQQGDNLTSPHPINSSMFQNYSNFKQTDIYCTL